MKLRTRATPPAAGASPDAPPSSDRMQAEPALPHERDESSSPPGTQRAPIRQAARDLAAGQVDTDNYTRSRETAKSRIIPRKS